MFGGAGCGRDQLGATLAGRCVAAVEGDRGKHAPGVDIRATQRGRPGIADERAGDGVTDTDGLSLRGARTVRSRTRQREGMALLRGGYGVHRAGHSTGLFSWHVYRHRVTPLCAGAGDDRAAVSWPDIRHPSFGAAPDPASGSVSFA